MLKTTKYTKQNDPCCLPDVQRVGCFFRSALNIVERNENVAFTPQQINIFWHEAHRRKIVDDNNNLQDSAALMDMVGDRHYVEVGLMKDNVFEPYGWFKKTGLEPQFFIRKHLQGGPSVYHYRVVDRNGNEIFEPHEPAIRDLGEVYTICYREF